VSYFTFGRQKICQPYLTKMGDENASHRMDQLRGPGRAWPALVGCRDVQIGPHAQRGNQLGLDAVRQSVSACWLRLRPPAVAFALGETIKLQNYVGAVGQQRDLDPGATRRSVKKSPAEAGLVDH
jgi:hypothetical protein